MLSDRAHAPFLFDGTGTLTRPEDYYEWRKPELYLAKLDYINREILTAVDNIQANDPDAVILLQADHGARTPDYTIPDEYMPPPPKPPKPPKKANDHDEA